MNQKWEIVTTAVAPLTNARRKAKIPDEDAYQKKIVELANQSWAGVINPAFRSKSGRTYEDIKGAHDTNLQKSFKQWTGKLDQAYATVDGVEAKRFKDQIQATKDFWSKKVGDKSLRLTGDSIRGEGAATIAVHWLIGEPSAAGMLRSQDTGLLGGPYRICPEDLASSLKAALMPKLVKAGMAIFNNKYEASTIVRQNLVQHHIKGWSKRTKGLPALLPI
jgi:hypothetical protein